MQEMPPFSSHLDFFPNVWEGGTPSHTYPLRTFNLPSGTPLISTVILLPSAESFKKGCCQLQAKVVHEVLVNCLFKLAQEKVWLGELTVPQ